VIDIRGRDEATKYIAYAGRLVRHLPWWGGVPEQAQAPLR